MSPLQVVRMALQSMSAIKDKTSECTGANARERDFHSLCLDPFHGFQRLTPLPRQPPGLHTTFPNIRATTALCSQPAG